MLTKEACFPRKGGGACVVEAKRWFEELCALACCVHSITKWPVAREQKLGGLK